MQQFLNVLLSILLLITSLFLVCLVLIQRGKGGGLAGAFGGVGGSSAFGTKAGDVFTKVTMISAGVWITLCMLLVVNTNRRVSVWPDAPKAAGKGDSKSIPIDLDKPGGLGDPLSIEKGPGLPLPLPKDSTAAPMPGVSGGSPSAPMPLPPGPEATPKKP